MIEVTHANCARVGKPLFDENDDVKCEYDILLVKWISVFHRLLYAHMCIKVVLVHGNHASVMLLAAALMPAVVTVGGVFGVCERAVNLSDRTTGTNGYVPFSEAPSCAGKRCLCASLFVRNVHGAQLSRRFPKIKHNLPVQFICAFYKSSCAYVYFIRFMIYACI